VKTPPTSYSRVEIEVVKGWITRCFSSLADNVSVQPSGEFGSTGGGAPSGGAGAVSAASTTGSTSG
jgi:hypothetical protein